MHISIEEGKTLIIRLMAVGPVVEGKAQRDVWFEVNGEVRPFLLVDERSTYHKSQVRAVAVEDKNSAIETVSREKATGDPGSVGAAMSGVVVEVRVKEGQEIKKGDPLCGKTLRSSNDFCIDGCPIPMISSERNEGEYILYIQMDVA